MTSRSRIMQQHAFAVMSKKLASRTHFTPSECQSLLSMHATFLHQGKLDRLRFREVIHACFDLYEDIMLDRVFNAFDKNNDGDVDAVEWVEGCSILIRGEPDELIDFCYFVYNINGDGFVDRDEIHHYLRKCFFEVPQVMPREDLDESAREIVELCMRKLDKDRDGQISYKDFEKACYADPLLVQALGPCIPATRNLAAFLALFTEKHRSYTSNWGDAWFKEGVSVKKNIYDEDDEKKKVESSNSSLFSLGSDSVTPKKDSFVPTTGLQFQSFNRSSRQQ